VVFDAHTSIMEGSIGAIPRRVMVVEEGLERARIILAEAGKSGAGVEPALSPGLSPGLSDDALLDGRVKLLQPAKGYRAAIDPVLLAAAVDAKETDMVLDAGAGAGAAALCLAARVCGVRVRGVEIDGFLAGLAMRNVEANGRAGHVDVIQGDILDAPWRDAFESLAPGGFDHVMANPPYYKAGSGNVSPDPAKAAATFEGAAALGDWIDFCVKMARPEGAVTLIHHAERLDELLGHMQGRLGEIVVFPLWPGRADKPSKRVIVRGLKGAAAPMRMAKGLTLHDDGGAFTPEAQAVLRDAQALIL